MSRTGREAGLYTYWEAGEGYIYHCAAGAGYRVGIAGMPRSRREVSSPRYVPLFNPVSRCHPEEKRPEQEQERRPITRR